MNGKPAKTENRFLTNMMDHQVEQLFAALARHLGSVIQRPRYSGHRGVVLVVCATALNCSGGAGLPAEFTRYARAALAGVENELATAPGSAPASGLGAEPTGALDVDVLTAEVQYIVDAYVGGIADNMMRARVDHDARFRALNAIHVMARHSDMT